MIDKQKVYLLHILECIADIERYTQGDQSRYVNDDLVRNGTLRQLQIMAESTTRIVPQVQALMPDIEWKRLAGFRNVLVHDYLAELDHQLIWENIARRLPLLKKAVQDYIRTHYGE